MGSPSLRLRVGTVLVASVLAFGCSKETGILVVVDRDDSVQGQIEHIEFSIGVAGSVPDSFALDEASSIEVPMNGRDLKVAPYELLIHPDDVSSAIVVAVTAWDGQGQMIGFGAFAAPQSFLEGKILMTTITLTGALDGGVLDTGCVKYYPPGGGEKIIIAPATDADCDGDGTLEVPPDCDDTDPAIGPSQIEICETTDVDEDCDGDPIEDVDMDLDGQSRCLGDCNDDDPDMNSLPDTFEICDGKDNDCDLACDNGDSFDFDGDGYTVCNTVPQGDGTCVHGVECDDLATAVHEGAEELCDGVDNDCNGVCDDGEGNDVDGDGFTFCGTNVGRCAEPTPMLIDCEPEVDWVHPFADEICDGMDSNCDGAPLYTTPCLFGDAGMDPASCQEGTALCDDNGEDGAFGLSACTSGGTGSANPAPGGLCSAYGSCNSAGDLDPWVCAFGSTSPALSVTCNVKVTGPLLQVCTSNTASIAGSSPGGVCSWWIYGGQQQDHYDVGLSTITSPVPAAGVDGCTGMFHVTGKNDPVPQDDTVWLGFTDTDASTIQVVQVDLVPVMVAACPAANALECTIAIP